MEDPIVRCQGPNCIKTFQNIINAKLHAEKHTAARPYCCSVVSFILAKPPLSLTRDIFFFTNNRTNVLAHLRKAKV